MIDFDPPAKPEVPDSDNKPDYEKSTFDKDLDLWMEGEKQVWNMADVARALAASRQDTLTALEAARADTAVALEEAREDTALALQEARDDALVAAERASLAGIEAAYISTTQSTIDRSLTRTNVLTATVGTIITLYTGLLAFIYTQADTATGSTTNVSAAPLQLVALIPALFLALALFLATVYAAVLKNGTVVGPFLPTGIGGQIAEMRLVTYMNWVFVPVLARRGALNGGIVSLGLGIATLPLPFVDASSMFEGIVLAAGLIAVGFTVGWQKLTS